MSTDSLASQLSELESAQLVRRLTEEEIAYLFKHALTQETAYDSLLHRTRRSIHLSVAQAYEVLYSADLDELASLLEHHFSAAGDDEKTVEYAIRAGDHARRLSAAPEAVMHYDVALESLSRLPDNRENRRRRVDAMISRASVSFALEAPQLGLSRLHAGESLINDLLRADPDSTADRLRRAQIDMWTGRMLFYAMDRRGALASFEKVLPVAQELGDRALIALASTLMARILIWEGEFGKAAPLFEQALDSIERSHDLTESVLASAMLGLAQAEQGNYHGGLRRVEQALERARASRDTNGLAIGYPILILTYTAGRAMQEALDASQAALPIELESKNWLGVYGSYAVQAIAKSRMGEHAGARQDMARADAITQQLGGHFLLDDWLAALKTEIALNAGEIQEAIRSAEQAIPFVRSYDGKFAEALVHRTWGEALARLDPPEWENAQEHLQSSLEILESCDARLEAAYTNVAWGRVLIAKGDPAGAREHLKRAAAQFQSSGLLEEWERASRLLAPLAE